MATVVSKLLEGVGPDVPGRQKDAQQVAVLRRMVRDLDVPVALRVVPHRPRGRRPRRLHPQRLPVRRRATARAVAAPCPAARDPGLVEGDLDYLAVVDPDPEPVEPRPGAIVIGAARFGSTRLIDNIPVEDS